MTEMTEMQVVPWVLSLPILVGIIWFARDLLVAGLAGLLSKIVAGLAGLLSKIVAGLAGLPDFSQRLWLALGRVVEVFLILFFTGLGILLLGFFVVAVFAVFFVAVAVLFL